jgi:hypothetical protein
MRFSVVSLCRAECASYVGNRRVRLVGGRCCAGGIPNHFVTNPIVVDWIVLRRSWLCNLFALGGMPSVWPAFERAGGAPRIQDHKDERLY